MSADGFLEKYRQSYNEGFPPSEVPHGFENDASAILNFNYELDFWGKNRDTLAAAVSEAKAAELDAEQAKLILTTTIASTYAKLLDDNAQLDATQKSLDVHRKIVSMMQERQHIGLENQGAVEQQKAQTAAIEAQLAAVQENINLVKNQLAALVGAKPERADSITRPDIASLNSLGLPDVIPADLIARRPDLAAASERMQAAAKRINVAHAGYYPNIDLMANIGHASLGLAPFWKNTSLSSSFGPAIHLPIFEGGQLEGNYRGARADYDTSVAQFEGAMLEALHQVADAVTSKKALVERTAKIKEAAEDAEHSYNVSMNRYHGGVGSYLDVLKSEDMVILAHYAEADIHACAFTRRCLGQGFGRRIYGATSNDIGT